MKKSVSLIRWVFGICGALLLAFNGFQAVFLIATLSRGLGFLTTGSVFPVIFLAIGLVSSIVYIYFGVMLPKYLTLKRVEYVKGVLLAVFGIPTLLSFVEILTQGGSLDYPTLIVGGLVTWYLYSNVQNIPVSSANI